MIQYQGATHGEQERELPEMIYCPVIDHNHTGRPNLPKVSCESRQKDKTFRFSTCYGGCKGSRPAAFDYSSAKFSSKAREKSHTAIQQRTKKIADQIEKYWNEGMTVLEIAEKVSRGKELVRARLRERGYILTYRRTVGEGEARRIEEGKKTAAKMIELYKQGKSVREIADITQRTEKIVIMRLTDAGLMRSKGGIKSKRAHTFELLDQQPDLTPQKIATMLEISVSTAMTYTRYWRDARGEQK